MPSAGGDGGKAGTAGATFVAASVGFDGNGGRGPSEPPPNLGPESAAAEVSAAVLEASAGAIAVGAVTGGVAFTVEGSSGNSGIAGTSGMPDLASAVAADLLADASAAAPDDSAGTVGGTELTGGQAGAALSCAECRASACGGERWHTRLRLFEFAMHPRAVLGTFIDFPIKVAANQSQDGNRE